MRRFNLNQLLMMGTFLALPLFFQNCGQEVDFRNQATNKPLLATDIGNDDIDSPSAIDSQQLTDLFLLPVSNDEIENTSTGQPDNQAGDPTDNQDEDEGSEVVVVDNEQDDEGSQEPEEASEEEQSQPEQVVEGETGNDGADDVVADNEEEGSGEAEDSSESEQEEPEQTAQVPPGNDDVDDVVTNNEEDEENGSQEETGEEEVVSNDDIGEDSQDEPIVDDTPSEDHYYYQCIQNSGKGKSTRMALASTGGLDGNKIGIKGSVCMSQFACEELVASQFDVQMIHQPSVCANNKHVIILNDSEVAALLTQ